MVKIPKLKQLEPVRITWQDAVGSPHGWVKVKKRDRAVRGCVTVGQVVKQTKYSVTLALSWDPYGKHVNGMGTIPVVCITKIERLK
jgi:hypothetical protein